MRDLATADFQFDRLDELAIGLAAGGLTGLGVLSTGERLYCELAANRVDLLEEDGYTIAEALARLGAKWIEKLVTRWQHRGNPKNFTAERT